ncbi:MAG: GNAT family N-acetyltransferase [Colwellia sp.]|nr:GNAT family N-acetyltransferase [Colwellia sp.]
MIVCESKRLIIRQFTLADAEFMLRLLNEESFIRNITDKNVRTITQAEKHLQEGPMASYKKFGFGLCLVALKSTKCSIGICGLLKREELAHPDLGYAFLPEYCGKGYALEAADNMLKQQLPKHSLTTVLAITSPDNHSSNKLLQKVGFKQTGMMELYNSHNNLYEYKSNIR